MSGAATTSPPSAIYHVGDWPGGKPILSHSGETPQDSTEVWIDEPDEAKRVHETVADLETRADQDGAGDIEWLLEPEVYDPKAAVTAAAKPALLFPLDDDEIEEIPATPSGDTANDVGTINGEVPTKGNVVLLPSDPGSLAVDGGDPPEALHMTMKFIGDLEPWTPENRELVNEAVKAWANTTGPVTATVAGVGSLGGEGAQVLNLEAPGLQQARSTLATSLDGIGEQVGADITDTYDGFIPHLTVGYNIDPPSDRQGQEVVFDRAAVQWGPERVEFPLGVSTDEAPADESAPEDTTEPAAEVAAVEPEATDVPADIEPPAKTEAEVDQLHELMDLAEERTGHIEGLVAQVMMARHKDKRMPGEAVTAGLGTPQALDIEAVRTPFVELDEVREALQQTAVVAAALDTIVDAAAEISVDDAARVDLLIERLDAIEETVAKLLEEQVKDVDMPKLADHPVGVVAD